LVRTLCYNFLVLHLRVLTAAVGLPAILLAVILGPGPFCIFLGVVSAVCSVELGRLHPHAPRDGLPVLMVVWAVALSLRFLTPLGDMPGLLITLPLVVALGMLVPLASLKRASPSWAWSVAGAIYVGWLMGYWGGLYSLESGAALVVFGLFTTFAYDTCAYLTGRSVGKHKVIPSVSSGKTWEGVVGGFCGALVAGLATHTVLGHFMGPFPFGSAVALGLAALLAIAAQTGDLVESALKRGAGVKDAGKILPGHGGMLDRFDSVLFTGTVLYYVSLWLTA